MQDLQGYAEYVAEKIKTAFNTMPMDRALPATRTAREELRLLEEARDTAMKLDIDDMPAVVKVKQVKP